MSLSRFIKLKQVFCYVEGWSQNTSLYVYSLKEMMNIKSI